MNIEFGYFRSSVVQRGEMPTLFMFVICCQSAREGVSNAESACLLELIFQSQSGGMSNMYANELRPQHGGRDHHDNRSEPEFRAYYMTLARGCNAFDVDQNFVVFQTGEVCNYRLKTHTSYKFFPSQNDATSPVTVLTEFTDL